VQQYLKERQAAGLPARLGDVAGTTGFRYFITALAHNQKTDINFFDASGQLVATTQNDIYEKALQARIMQPGAYRQITHETKPLFTRQEGIGGLQYIACYVPLRYEDGSIQGYINVPFFSLQQELDAQISGILIALLNLFAFIFLISGLMALFTTRWLTRTLNIIISQFERLTLHGNELLDWPDEDEIGLLVREYNKMVRKVEENAALLARSEREGAWREMARQVAHEIKNPLTPMKLNIQFLQRAVQGNRPDVAELAARVMTSLLEQIDNLSYIASEFSDFARIPEAKPELLVLNELLENAVSLYQKEPRTKVVLEAPQEGVTVLADRSQVIRVLTNLLQNAVQAIPEERTDGLIRVTMTGEGGSALICVEDNGGGIPAEAAGRIFTPYFTTKSSGTGLGLAMSRRIVEQWGGEIWFKGAEGGGTRFFVRLPLAGEQAEKDLP
jgi:signal transduction histidine kinase